MIFDLFGTLVDQVERFFPEAARLLGISQPDLLVRWREDAEARNLGRRTFAESMTRLCRDLCSESESVAPLVVKMGLDELARNMATATPTALAALQRLADELMPTALVSNNWIEVLDFWPQCPVEPYFPKAVFSSLVGLAKPQAAIYRLAYEPLGFKPEECLFVGDGGDEELEGAAALGMTAVQVTHRLPPITAAHYHFDSVADVLGLLGLRNERRGLQS